MVVELQFSVDAFYMMWDSFKTEDKSIKMYIKHSHMQSHLIETFCVCGREAAQLILTAFFPKRSDFRLLNAKNK